MHNRICNPSLSIEFSLGFNIATYSFSWWKCASNRMTKHGPHTMKTKWTTTKNTEKSQTHKCTNEHEKAKPKTPSTNNRNNKTPKQAVHVSWISHMNKSWLMYAVFFLLLLRCGCCCCFFLLCAASRCCMPSLNNPF